MVQASSLPSRLNNPSALKVKYQTFRAEEHFQALRLAAGEAGKNHHLRNKPVLVSKALALV